MPQVYCDAVAFASPQDADKFSADLFVYVPHSVLRFLRVDGEFTASYSAKISIKNGQVNIFDTTFSRKISTQIYANTNGENPKIDYLQHRIELPIISSSYTVIFDITDQNANDNISVSRELNFQNISNFDFALSGVLLVTKIRESGTGYTITPMITEDVVSSSDGYFAFFEAYNKSNKKDFKFSATYKNFKDETLISPIWVSKNIGSGVTQQWLKMGFLGIPRGNMFLEIKAFYANDTLTPIASTRRTIRASGSKYFPIADRELKDALDKMRYVANQSDLDLIASANSFAEKLKRFTEFWKTLDPTPNTAINEAMDEYYERVEKADNKYSGMRQGRNTERGRVLIIYGTPDNVNTDAFRKDGKTVETWYYNRHGRTITFVDDTGFGDFRLVTPIPYSEKYQYGN